MTYSKTYKVLVAGLISCASAAIAVAQTTPPAAAPEAPSADSGALAEIVVTAERRTQRLQDVPIAATVLSRDDVINKGVNNASDFQRIAPSVAINTVGRSTFINIRGVGLAVSGPNSVPGVAYYLDGSLIPHEQFIGQTLYDIGSVEVLRGPQGTLTGQNSTGGAVFVRTVEPAFNDFSGRVEGQVGNYRRIRGMLAVNWSDSDNVAVRASYLHDEQKSFTKNIGSSRSSPGSLNMNAGRVNLALRSNEQTLRVNLRGEVFDSRNGAQPVKNRNDLVTKDPFTIEEDAHSWLYVKGYRVSGEAKYQLASTIDARGIITYQHAQVYDQLDGDRTTTALPVPAALPVTTANVTAFPGRVQNTHTRNPSLIGEVNLLSTGKGPFQWVVGGFILDEDVNVPLLRDSRNNTDFVSPTNFTNIKIHNNSKSVFGQANWYALPALELIAGARYSWDRQNYGKDLVGNNNYIYDLSSSKSLTGKVGVNYHIPGGSLAYVTFSKGYKAGGGQLVAGQAPFGPEVNYVVEGGLKTTLLDRHLRVNADVYHSTYKNIQLVSIFAGLPLTQNAASSESYGAEIEVTAQFGGFGANFSAGYLHGEFSEDACINDSYRPGTDPGCSTGNRLVAKGTRLPFAPVWTINGGAEYAVPLSNGMRLVPRVQFAHLDAQRTAAFASDRTHIDGRTIVDLRLRLESNSSWQLEGYVENVGNRTYLVSQIGDTSSATGGYIYGAPRTFGIRGSWNFGR